MESSVVTGAAWCELKIAFEQSFEGNCSYCRYEVSSHISGRYTRITAMRRASKGDERYLYQRISEGSGVCRMGDPIFGRWILVSWEIPKTGLLRQ